MAVNQLLSPCRLCGLVKPLIKAHILPRKFYKPIVQAGGASPAGDTAVRIYPVDANGKSRQEQSGIYDSNILCADCDCKVIGSWDLYAQTLLLGAFDPNNYSGSSTNRLYRLDNFDYIELKLFFMSLLWRASISSRSFFKNVDLGPWEARLKQKLLAADPGSRDDYSVIIIKYEGMLAEVMPNPSKQRQDGINFYRFRAPGYSFLLKVDQRPFIRELQPHLLAPNSPLLISVRQYQESSEYDALIQVRNQIPQR